MPEDSAGIAGGAAASLPLARWRARVAAGELARDAAQAQAAERLGRLHRALEGYAPAPTRFAPSRFAAWPFRIGRGGKAAEPPRGLYLHGGVGRGKSMLMDLFFDAAPVARKRRVHFHEFMLEIHDRMHRRRAAAPGRVDDLLPAVAADIAAEAWLLCFDELHVVNIADAMILGRLFEALFARGAVMVATSNRPPDRLYEGGLQRQLFLPFIDLLKRRLDVLHLEAARDYRRARLMTMQVWRTPLGPAATRALDAAFAALTGGAAPAPARLAVKGREVPVPCAARGVARFPFDDLCRTALGAADYLAIADAYRTVMIDDIPRFKPDEKSPVMRFAILIDTLYERRAALVASAAGAPQDLYRGTHVAMEFRRTVSRLMEMQSRDWLEARRDAG